MRANPYTPGQVPRVFAGRAAELRRIEDQLARLVVPEDEDKIKVSKLRGEKRLIGPSLAAEVLVEDSSRAAKPATGTRLAPGPRKDARSRRTP